MRKKSTKRRILLLITLALIAGSVMFCSPGYVIRAGLAEAKILSRREPIEEVIRAPGTDEETRDKLAVVVNVRSYAENELELDVGDSYTTFSQLDTDTLLMVVTASRKDAFDPYTWWFPIVGRVPYKGFFDPDDARAQARSLEERGYDVAVRPSGAFSTLGWFNDPLLSTILGRDHVSLASTVIHEVTHNTTFISGQVGFNESFANFVGDVGATEFFCALEGETGARCRLARARWQDELVFGDALARLLAALENVYGDPDLDYQDKLEAREVVMDRWREGYEREIVPRLQVAFKSFHRRPLNNASLLGMRLYYDRLHLFDRAYRQLDLPLDRAIATMIDAAESRPADPFGAIARLANGGEAGGG
jgi:predicted aminopeptidase